MKTIAWFVFNVSVQSPIQKRIRVTLLSPKVFKYKGHVYRMVASVAYDVDTHEKLGAGRIEDTAKKMREDYIQSECRRACDPNSELYWTM